MIFYPFDDSLWNFMIDIRSINFGPPIGDPIFELLRHWFLCFWFSARAHKHLLATPPSCVGCSTAFFDDTCRRDASKHLDDALHAAVSKSNYWEYSRWLIAQTIVENTSTRPNKNEAPPSREQAQSQNNRDKDGLTPTRKTDVWEHMPSRSFKEGLWWKALWCSCPRF